jgi:hypothetical protein
MLRSHWSACLFWQVSGFQETSPKCVSYTCGLKNWPLMWEQNVEAFWSGKLVGLLGVWVIWRWRNLGQLSSLQSYLNHLNTYFVSLNEIVDHSNPYKAVTWLRAALYCSQLLFVKIVSYTNRSIYNIGYLASANMQNLQFVSHPCMK